jgi:hypothetical protein
VSIGSQPRSHERSHEQKKEPGNDARLETIELLVSDLNAAAYGAAGALVEGVSTGGADSCLEQPDTTATTATTIAI